jgi:molybdopterin synthase catalytic subunit
MAFYFSLTKDPICIEDATRQLNLDGNGAVVTFSGHIRSEDSHGQQLSHMDYEAYEEMAEPEARKIAATIHEKWGIDQVALIHRYGRVEVGEPSVVIAVASGHRPEAFDACRFAIDELKRTVPLWKNEVIAARAEV